MHLIFDKKDTMKYLRQLTTCSGFSITIFQKNHRTNLEAKVNENSLSTQYMMAQTIYETNDTIYLHIYKYTL